MNAYYLTFAYMNFQFYAQGLKLNESQEEYARDKISNVAKNAQRVEDESSSVKVNVEKTNLPGEQAYLVEVTLVVPKNSIRAEVFASSVEEGLDQIEEKLRKQVERYKGKMHRRNEKGEWLETSTLETIEEDHMEGENMSKITKRKRYESTRGKMSEEEAIENLELLGHDFYLFENADTGRFSVLYRRYEGNYGIIEPLKNGETKED